MLRLMTSSLELQETPNHLHGLGSEGFHELSASVELLRLRFHDSRAKPCSSMARQQEKKKGELAVSKRIREVKMVGLL